MSILPVLDTFADHGNLLMQRTLRIANGLKSAHRILPLSAICLRNGLKSLPNYMESFRAAVPFIGNIKNTKPRIPMTIYVLHGSSDFRRLGLNTNLAGFFRRNMREYTLVMRGFSGWDDAQLMLHEYTHFLVRNHGGHQYPIWFSEGFAEYLSSAELQDGEMKLGFPATHRAASLSYGTWIPMRRMLVAEKYRHKWSPQAVNMFYAESWALVHYLFNRGSESVPFKVAMPKYLQLMEQGVSGTEAFESAFELSVKELNHAVRVYLNRGRFDYFRVDTEKLLPNFEPTVKKLTSEQMALNLGKLALSSGSYDKAERLFSVAAKHDETAGQAEAGLGDVYKFQDKFDLAEPHFERAIEHAPNDPYCQLDMAEYWHTRAKQSEDANERLDFIKKARIHYVKAWELNAEMAETYAQYGHTFIMEGKRFERAVELLEEAQYLLPSDLTIRLMLAEGYLGADRHEEAILAARSVLAWSHGESDAAKQARKILTALTVAKVD